MELPVAAVPGAAARWIHVLSTVLLVGGLAFARLAMRPVTEGVPGLLSKALLRYRAVVYVSIAGLFVTGIYNLLLFGGHSRTYHMLLGIKILLALHIFAAAVVATREGADERRRSRQLTGLIVSGAVVIFLGVFLRYV